MHLQVHGLVIAHASPSADNVVLGTGQLIKELTGRMTEQDSIAPSWTSCSHVLGAFVRILFERIGRRKFEGKLAQTLLHVETFLIVLLPLDPFALEHLVVIVQVELLLANGQDHLATPIHVFETHFRGASTQTGCEFPKDAMPVQAEIEVPEDKVWQTLVFVVVNPIQSVLKSVSSVVAIDRVVCGIHHRHDVTGIVEQMNVDEIKRCSVKSPSGAKCTLAGPPRFGEKAQRKFVFLQVCDTRRIQIEEMGNGGSDF